MLFVMHLNASKFLMLLLYEYLFLKLYIPLNIDFICNADSIFDSGTFADCALNSPAGQSAWESLQLPLSDPSSNQGASSI